MVVEDLLGAAGPAPSGIGVGGRCDHAGTGGGGELHHGAADAARASADDDGVTRAESRPPEEAEAGGARGVQNRYGLSGIDAGRKVVEPLGGHDDVLCERALPPAVAKAVAPDPVAFGEADRTRSGRGDRVAADDERERCRRPIRSGAHQRVDLVNRQCFCPHQHVGRAECGDGQLPDLDALSGTQRGDVSRQRVHRRAPDDGSRPAGPGSIVLRPADTQKIAMKRRRGLP